MAIKDLSGEKFGMLTVLEYAGKSEKGYHSWKCKCDCGKIVVKSGKGLRNGHITSCGCRHKAKDLTGMVFGNLKVVKIVGKKIETHYGFAAANVENMLNAINIILKEVQVLLVDVLEAIMQKKQGLVMESLQESFIKSGVP